MYYAPWDAESQYVKQEFEKAATIMGDRVSLSIIRDHSIFFHERHFIDNGGFTPNSWLTTYHYLIVWNFHCYIC